MGKLLSLLKGKKSYLATIALGILGIFWSEEMVSDEQAKIIGPILLSVAGLCYRSGMNNAAEQAVQKLWEDETK